MVTRKLLIYINSLLLTAFTVPMLLVGVNASATSTPLTWQDEVDVQFTFNPALSVTISDGDIIIPNLGVGTRDNSNEIAITVTTNNIAGYQLSATVGNSSTYDYRELKHETTSTALFNSLAVGTTLNQLSTPSTWGYSTDSGTSYSGLPKYDDTTNVAILNDSDASGTETTNFLIGAYADQNQLAGDYRNVINFNVVTNVVPAPAMQNMIASLCTASAPTTVRDIRDNEEYLVQRLADGKCWMLDNLRLDPTRVDLATLQGNTNASDQTLDYLLNGGGTTSDKYPTAGLGNLTEGNSYSVPRINATYKETVNSDASKNYGEGSHMYGVYYNYCAASAGSYCYGDGNSAGTSVGDAGEDICPAGWRMPTGGANTVTTDGKGEYQALYTAYGSNATNFSNALSTPLSGDFYNGSALDQGSLGYFWSSTRYGDYGMYYLYVDSSDVYPQSIDRRNLGNSVRCLLQ